MPNNASDVGGSNPPLSIVPEDRKILWSASNCGYEDGWSVEIFEYRGKLYKHSIVCGFFSHDEEIEEISQDEGLSIMFEELEYED